MKVTIDNLYELTPYEFERLCAQLLKAQGIDQVEVVDGPNDQGVDIIGKFEGQPLAVQVKHVKRLSPSTIQREIYMIKSSSYKPKRILYITSAKLTSEHKKIIKSLSADIDITLLGQEDVLNALNKYQDVGKSTFLPAQKRSKRQRLSLVTGFLVSFASILAVSFPIISFYVGREKAPLEERIEAVKRTILSLKDLEQHLTYIKKDMEETQRMKNAIEAEYEKAKILEKFSDEQLKAIKTALSTHTWRRTVLDYIFGFLFGVASSLIASVLYARWRQRRTLIE